MRAYAVVVKALLLTNEYPPNVYGGAGVHVEYLSRELARAESRAHHIEVFCFGDQHQPSGNLRVHGVAPPVRFQAQDPRHAKLLDALVRASAGQDPRKGGIAVVAEADYIRQMLEISETGGVVLLAENREEALEALPGA